MGEHQQLPGPEVGLDLAVVDRLLERVGDGDHDHVGLLHGVGDGRDLEARGLGDRAALGAVREADDHAHARVAKVLRVGMALAPVPDDGDGLPVERREIGVGVVVHLGCHWVRILSVDGDDSSGRAPPRWLARRGASRWPRCGRAP